VASTDTAEHPEPTRRDFIYIATGAVAAVGTALAVWPLIDQMNPDQAALALASIDVDVSSVTPGMSMTVKWRGKPVVIRRRTDAEVEEAQKVDLDTLRDRYARNANLADDALATDANRAVPGMPSWLIMIEVCTHLGCIPLGEQGLYGGWFCPCHGSQYDTAGRIRQGPAPQNMAIPPYAFVSETNVKIG
jgi:ubiquinol-cytochrome c reductase iron-sulfur subunit